MLTLTITKIPTKLTLLKYTIEYNNYSLLSKKPI